MTHYDESSEAVEFVTNLTCRLMQEGISQEEAMSLAIDEWNLSLERLQAKKRYEDQLRGAGRPTLSVSLGELAKFKRA